MQTFAQYALPATIVASALGAVALCVVLFFFGFRSEMEDERLSPSRRLFVIRLGHALAAACFAAALMLGSVALFEQRRVAAPAPSSVAAQPSDDVRRLEAQVRSLEGRLAATELRLGDAAQRLSSDGSRSAVPPTASRPARRTTPSARRPTPTAVTNGAEGAASPATLREPGEAMTVRPATSEPIAPPARVASSSDDLGTKVRGDWQTVKRGFRQAGDDMRSGFTDFGRRLKKTFTREGS
jgi:hypothetical protein